MRGFENAKRRVSHALRHKHHVDLKPAPFRFGKHGAPKVVYVFPKPPCHVHYSSSEGYSVHHENGHALVTDPVPLAESEDNKTYVYLAALPPEKRSFRFWKCPKCDVLSAVNP